MSEGARSGFSEVVTDAWNENHLIAVLLELTYRCNLDCFFCYNDLGKKGRLVATERYLSFLEECREEGVLVLALSGGEPLMHPGFWEIATRASDLAFSLRIKTNGHGFTEDSIERLYRDVRPFRVEISLHGGRAETHDRQTRVPGSFARLMTVIPAMLRAGLRVKLNSTLTSWNVGEVEEMWELAESFGVLLTLNPVVSPRDNGDLTPLMIAPSSDEMERVYALEAVRQAHIQVESEPDEVPREAGSEKACGAGSSSVTIDPFGDVLPCVQWRRPVGNILDRSLRDIWSGNGRLGEVRELAVAAKRTRDSLPQLPAGGFCPGMAEIASGFAASAYSLPVVPRLPDAALPDRPGPRRSLSLLPVSVGRGRAAGSQSPNSRESGPGIS